MHQNLRSEAAKLLAVFTTGAFSYGIIEICARGFTHISMGLLGGLAMYLIHLLNRSGRTAPNVFLTLMISALFITACELITGEIVNRQLGLNVWDYSMMPMNFDGQICLPFTLIWFALSAVGIMLDDLMRKKIFGEQRDILFLQSSGRTAV